MQDVIENILEQLEREQPRSSREVCNIVQSVSAAIMDGFYTTYNYQSAFLIPKEGPEVQFTVNPGPGQDQFVAIPSNTLEEVTLKDF